MQTLVYLLMFGIAAASMVTQVLFVFRARRGTRPARTSRVRVVLEGLVVVFLLAVMRGLAVTALTQLLWLTLLVALAVAVAVTVYCWPRIPRTAGPRHLVREDG